jgi:hypothetical protein
LSYLSPVTSRATNRFTPHRLPIAPPEATITESSIFAAYRASREVAPKDAGPRGKRSSYPLAQYRASGEVLSGFGGRRKFEAGHKTLVCILNLSAKPKAHKIGTQSEAQVKVKCRWKQLGGTFRCTKVLTMPLLAARRASGVC